MERWVVAAVFACLFAVMALRPQTLAFWRIDHRPERLLASRAIGVAGLALMAVVLVYNLLS
ncbi:MAG: hypothetical protein RIF41_28540 [Polyangiaceae bacterium]